MDLVKKVREKLNLPIAIMLDTKGPEVPHPHLRKRKYYPQGGRRLYLHH